MRSTSFTKAFRYSVIGFIFLTTALLGCAKKEMASQTIKSEDKIVPKNLSEEFKNYWYDGTAELTSFKLEQARYGEMREGTAIAVFVAEDFSKSRFVKLDEPDQHPNDRAKVLKFNLNKQFKTGIYDYALMQSVFTPIHQDILPNTLRVTTSNIEWCGQFLTRMELQENSQYKVQYNSYFDGEENTTKNLPVQFLEDEIWNQIRINPERLPQGVINIIPGILTQELTHQELRLETASATVYQESDLTKYELEYSSIPRKLVIIFDTSFPYQIYGWEETFMTVGGWGMEPKLMTTRATKIADTKLDYWERKYLKDEILRIQELGLKN